MILSLIVAASENNVIGKDNALPWRLPDDLKYFRHVTEGKPVIMGRKTFESIGKPLPKRTNIVLTSKGGKIPGCYVMTSLPEAIELARESRPEEAFVIGGADVFAQALPSIDYLYLTRVHATVEGNVLLPEIDWNGWEEISREEHAKDAKHAYPFTFLVYKRPEKGEAVEA